MLKASGMQAVWLGGSEEFLWVTCKSKTRTRKVGEGPVINAILFLFEPSVIRRLREAIIDFREGSDTVSFVTLGNVVEER